MHARLLPWAHPMSSHNNVITLDNSPFVARVSFMSADRASETLATPDGAWDLVFIRNEFGIRALRTGLTTRAVRLQHAEGEQILAISFKPSVNLATIDPVASLDRGYVLDSDRRKFQVAGHVFEIPTFANCEGFIEHLTRSGLLRTNRIVQS